MVLANPLSGRVRDRVVVAAIIVLVPTSASSDETDEIDMIDLGRGLV